MSVAINFVNTSNFKTLRKDPNIGLQKRQYRNVNGDYSWDVITYDDAYLCVYDDVFNDEDYLTCGKAACSENLDKLRKYLWDEFDILSATDYQVDPQGYFAGDNDDYDSYVKDIAISMWKEDEYRKDEKLMKLIEKLGGPTLEELIEC